MPQKKLFFVADSTILLSYVVGWQSRSFLYSLVAIFGKNLAFLVKHFFKEIFVKQSVLFLVLK